MNPQALMDGLVAGSMIGLGAIGVTLTYSILRFANFAHGEFISWGAYFALAVAGALGALSGGAARADRPVLLRLGAADRRARRHRADRRAGAAGRRAAVRPPARPQRSTVIIMVMASFGAALTLRSLLEFIFTSKPAYYTKALQIAMPLGGGLRATPDQLLSLGRLGRAGRRRASAADAHRDRPLDARRQREPAARRRRRHRSAPGDPHRLAARRRRSPASPASAPGCWCRSGRRWGSTCCCRCLPPRSSAASAACRARCWPG